MNDNIERIRTVFTKQGWIGKLTLYAMLRDLLAEYDKVVAQAEELRLDLEHAEKGRRADAALLSKMVTEREKLVRVVEAARAVSDYDCTQPDWDGNFCPWEPLAESLKALDTLRSGQ